MIHLFINALAASAGGGLTYVRNVVPHLAEVEDVRVTVVLNSALRDQLAAHRNVALIEWKAPDSAASRFWFEQRHLPALIRHVRADVLLSTGNFALWHSPVPQILLSRNALYTSGDFLRDLRRRGDYSLWLDTQLKATFAKWSIHKADVTIAPSQAFADELQQWAGVDVVAIHHGFDRALFCANSEPIPDQIRRQLDAAEGSVRLLFVSHYNYYRNFETLIRAVPLLRDRLAPRKIRVILTCRLQSEFNPGSYRAGLAADLVRELGVSENVIELGSIPYNLLHYIHRACDIYVTPAYAESFAHPLVEAMSSGLPIVASDLPVHREICEEAALYFPPFSHSGLADQVTELYCSTVLEKHLSARALSRAQEFSWEKHVKSVLAVAVRLSNARE